MGFAPRPRRAFVRARRDRLTVRQPEGVRGALEDEAKPLVVARVRAVLALGIVSIALSIAFDARLQYERLPTLIALKGLGMVAYAIAAVGLQRVQHASWRRLVASATTGVGLICLLNIAIGTFAGDVLMAAYVLTVVTLGGAVFFPWGVQAQRALVSIATAGLAVNLRADPAIWIRSPNLVIAVLSAFAASVWAAAALEKQRLDAKAADLLRTGRKRVLELIARDAGLDEVLNELLRTTEAQSPGMLCSVLLLDEDRQRLRHGAALGLPEDWICAADGIVIGPEVHTCGSAAFLGTRVVTADIANDAGWTAYRDLAARHGLRACWAEPILAADGTVLGTFALYYRTPRAPTPAEIELVEVAAHLAGIAIARGAARRQLERYLTALDDAREQAEQQTVQLR